jgi:hypothetical protein
MDGFAGFATCDDPGPSAATQVLIASIASNFAGPAQLPPLPLHDESDFTIEASHGAHSPSSSTPLLPTEPALPDPSVAVAAAAVSGLPETQINQSSRKVVTSMTHQPFKLIDRRPIQSALLHLVGSLTLTIHLLELPLLVPIDRYEWPHVPLTPLLLPGLKLVERHSNPF